MKCASSDSSKGLQPIFIPPKYRCVSRTGVCSRHCETSSTQNRYTPCLRCGHPLPHPLQRHDGDSSLTVGLGQTKMRNFVEKERSGFYKRYTWVINVFVMPLNLKQQSNNSESLEQSIIISGENIGYTFTKAKSGKSYVGFFFLMRHNTGLNLLRISNSFIGNLE